MKRANDGQKTSHHPKSSVFFRSEMCDGYTYLPYQWEQPEEQCHEFDLPDCDFPLAGEYSSCAKIPLTI
ncbi:hypothetical protein G5I_04297 [Acromyrmex echinatior]|uniref:Uncharacterized protein n=1 Tax=Acromyrmex echinatior TaxID=103372 RepID=F4WF90_ACREC|nr:hypothetical protein G5I_04297 [Acromyrmex echinatior]